LQRPLEIFAGTGTGKGAGKDDSIISGKEGEGKEKKGRNGSAR